jgi:acetyl-CoA carboxylase biotin carboxyl carrier protein
MSKKPATKSAAKKEDKSLKPASIQPEMKTSEIRDLIDFISKTGLNEVNIETKELKLHVKREPDQKIFKSSSVMPVSTAPAVIPQQAQPALSPPATPKADRPAESSGKKTVEIKSPMIGTFYRSSTPDSPPFVSVGDKVSKGQTVCIIEAMKLFNEIESEVSGTVVKVMVENSSPVEYDQVLFVVEPD